jgi:tetratricopeptide (TPR) repeat protein
MRDVREGVNAYLFLSERNEMESATKRLSESFLVGEYMPEIRTLSREKKRLALTYSQKGNRLVNAISVKDYGQAEQLIKDMEILAKDFDPTKPRAAVETAKTISAMHLAKARNAAIAGNNQVVEDELKQAAAVWPRNPALLEMSGTIFGQSDLQQKAIADFDQLLSQGNIRQIFNDKLRFIAAMATNPDRQNKLKKVLEDMQTIEASIARAQEFARRGDTAGAWEAVERAAQQFPDDVKLNQLRGNYSSEAAAFVESLKTAQRLETQGQTGSGLAWYLKAQRHYPLSDYAKEGIERLAKKILPSS